MLIKVDELTEPPVVGKYYLVRVVHGTWCGKAMWFPVMGDLHEDSKFFNFERQHYHLDRRFVAAGSLADALVRPLHALPERYGRLATVLSEPEWASRKCRHAMTEFPTYHMPVVAMQRHLAGVQCQRHETGWVCPHRGFRLGSIEPDSNGIILCPLHGLQIDAASGKVI